MPRRPRVYVEGAIYHVYSQFIRGGDLFADPEEAIKFIEKSFKTLGLVPMAPTLIIHQDFVR